MKKEIQNSAVACSQVAAVWSSIEKAGNLVTFRMEGDSMDDGTADSYKPDELLICQPVEQIEVNRDYVIVRPNETIVGRVVAKGLTGSTIAVHSLNPMHKDETIDLHQAKMYKIVLSQRTR